MKKTYLRWIIVFLTFSTLLPGERAKSIDQTIKGFEKKLQRVSGKEKVDVLNELAYSYISKSPVKCIEYAGQAFTLARELGYLRGQARALQNKGIGNAILANSEKALDYFRQALEAAKKAGDKKLCSKILGNTGILYTRMNNPRKALDFQMESLEIEKEIGNKPGIAAVLSNIGITYHRLGDKTRALDTYLKSLKMYDELENKNEREISNVIFSIGTVYTELDRPHKALEYLQNSLKIKKEVGDRVGIAEVFSAIAGAYQNANDYNKALEYNKKALKIAEEIGLKLLIPRCTGNMGMIYEELKDYRKALECYRKSLKIGNETGEKLVIGLASIFIGKVQTKLQFHTRALKNIQRGITIAKEIEKKDLLARGYEALSLLYETKGNHENALEYYKRFHQTTRDILNEKNQEQINELQAEYEAEKKAKEIEVLKKNNEIQDLRLSKAEFTRNALITGIILVVIILALLFKKYLYLFAFWKKQKHIGQFRLLDKIASGGMGTVFKAHTITGKSEIAAVKILKEELFADEINKKRFKRESAIIDKLEHPHIVKIIERGESKQQLFIAMEFLEGKTVEDRLNRDNRLPLNDALHIMRQVSDTVGFIHGKNVIHRDLKPANIMLIEKDGDPNFVKLLDFGLARIEFETRVTQSGNFLGTIEYVSPEQLLDAHSTPAGDIFAMGVTFYRMLCGKSPFPGQTVIDTMRKIIGEDPADLSQFRPDIPVDLNRLVKNMMHKKPDQRPPAESIKNTLNLIDSGTGIS